MHYATAKLPELMSEAQQISSRTIATFGTLSYEQLNWKPTVVYWFTAESPRHSAAEPQPKLRRETLSKVIERRIRGEQTFCNRVSPSFYFLPYSRPFKSLFQSWVA